MVTFNFNASNFEEMQIKIRLVQYQTLANQIIESYDFNDIKSGISYAKEKTLNHETINIEEKFGILDSLFESLISYLQNHGRKV